MTIETIKQNDQKPPERGIIRKIKDFFYLVFLKFMSLVSSVWASILSFKNLFRFKRGQPIIPQTTAEEENKSPFFSDVYDASSRVKIDLVKALSAIVELNYTSAKILEIKELEIEDQIKECLNQMFEKIEFSEIEKIRVLAALNLCEREAKKEVTNAIDTFSFLDESERKEEAFRAQFSLNVACNDIKTGLSTIERLFLGEPPQEIDNEKKEYCKNTLIPCCNKALKKSEGWNLLSHEEQTILLENTKLSAEKFAEAFFNMK